MGAKFAHCSPWEERCREVGNKNSSQAGRPSVLIKHKASMASLWIDGLYLPSSVNGEQGALEPACDEENHDSEVNGFVALLRACARDKDLCIGRKVHNHILKQGLLKVCSDALITMYVKCGALSMAKHLLDLHGSENVRTWTALIAGYAQKDQGQDALNCFERMRHQGLLPDAVTYTCILKACGSIGAASKGEQIHDEVAKQGLLSKNVLLGNSLVAMYAKCGALRKAQKVLNNLPVQTASPWNSLIAGFTEQGKGGEALDCFKKMQQRGLPPDAVTYTCILKACGSMGALDKGDQIYDEIAGQGLLGSSILLDNALVSMYAKCHALKKARQVLEEIPVRNAISWNALITGYAQENQAQEVLSCFEQMQHEGISPSAITFACILKACGHLGAVRMGEKIHEQIAKEGLLRNDVVLGTALVDMYAKCGSLTKARCVLEELPVRNVVSWNALIAGYIENAEGEQALSCFEEMQHEKVSPNALTLSYILKACGNIGVADKGVKVHDMITKQGLLGHDIVLGTALVDMYAKCGALTKAQKVFEELPVRDAVSWSALITGYAQNSKSEQALECYDKMQGEGLSPDAVTFICILKACACLRAADKGTKVHEKIAEQGFLGNDIVLGTALLDMYAKCNALAKAREVFEDLPARNVVTWNALIAGYAENGNYEEALEFFQKMQQQGFTPDAVTYICILKACGSVGAADRGEKVHDDIAQQGHWENHTALGTALVDMYAKCGALAKARQVLEELPIRDAISWNALMMGYVKQGESKHAIDCFETMQNDGLFPDAATFSCVFIACSRLGLVEKAQSHFLDMNTKYGVIPDLEHYTCMVDVFGRAGHFTKALGLIARMPSCNFDVWSTLLAACQKWGDVNTGRWAFEHALQVDKSDAAAYILMASIYAASGMQEDVENINTMRIENRAWRKPAGLSWWIDTH